MKRIFDINPWKIISHDLKSEDKRLQESMTSIGNEYMGMRGMFEEKYSADSHKGIYLGGVWFPDKTRVGWWKNGYPDYFGKAINAVDFVSLDIKINGDSVDLAKDRFSDYEVSLDMQEGILYRSYCVEKGTAKVRITFQRLVSVAFKELYANRISIENLGQEALTVEINSFIDADVFNEDSNYDEQFWEVLDKTVSGASASLTARTIANPFGVPQFTTQMTARHLTDLTESSSAVTAKATINRFKGQLEAAKTATFEKRVVIVTSRDYETREALQAASDKFAVLEAQLSFAQIKKDQIEAWKERWKKADVTIEGNDEAQQGIRFNLFQLFSTYYGQDSRLNIGPKGFTGEKYGGATYWDTEAFAVPLFLSVADQSITENLLKYRHEQLEGAYHNARQQGLAGALYPMVTFNGIECHNEWEITFEEIHRNGSIAYAIYNYSRYTGDDTYATHDGFDVLVGIARFWADRVHYSKRRNQYMIHGVTGPNEYENNINNNWYTNILARWCLTYTNEVASKVFPEKLAELSLDEAERQNWQEIAEKMYLPEDEELGIFVQHDGFLDKDLTPVADLAPENLPLNQNWSWDRILRSPYIKQADVLQGVYYFIDNFSQDEKKRNFEFYEPLTVHESSLSPSIHSILAADLQMEEKAVEMYARTARLDLDNYNNDTEDGLHITSMTGSWLSIVQGFAGMRIRDGKLVFSPFVPKEWTGYHFHINFRGRLLKVIVAKDDSRIELLSGDDLTIVLNDKELTLTK